MDGHYINLHCKKSSLPFKDPFFFGEGITIFFFFGNMVLQLNCLSKVIDQNQ